VLYLLDHRLLSDLVDLEGDLVPNAAADDPDAARLAVQNERHGEDGLEGIALRAAGRADVGLAARRAGREVQDARDRLPRDAGAVVGHCNAGAGELDPNLGRGARLLGGVDRVVDQLFDDHQGPGVRLMPGLCHQLLAAAELEEPARAERRALQGRRGRHHASSQTRQRSAGWSGSQALRR
jgi:hypothetical protein